VARRLEFPLRGAGGEPVELWRTLNSHGFVDLPPMRLDEHERTLEITIPLAGARPRTVRVADGNDGRGTVTVLGPTLGERTAAGALAGIEHVLRLDADLSGFYELAQADPDLAWVTSGAGRMVRSPTVFEDVVKTICTTNCTWSATKRMVGALVEHLGAAAPGAPSDGPYGRAFPTPGAMAEAGEGFYRDVARAGYRSPHLLSVAQSVAGGHLDLEILGRASPEDVPDADLEGRLLGLPGVGPYAAAHVMLTLGRYSKLILDSWTRPAYARHVGRKAVSDAAMARRFKRYGPYAGLAFWLILTRDWV
jgi:3-methyladenine DNA glycosylase/8-oxoguanine DNA glycosylase